MTTAAARGRTPSLARAQELNGTPPEPEPSGAASWGRAVGTLLSDVAPTVVSWLWPGRIPAGRLTILDGDPGLGKSSVTLDLAARVTREATMPDGSRGLNRPRGVVLLGCEDGLSDTARPRLDAAGADVSRVYALTGIRDGEGHPRLPTVGDVLALQEAAERVDAALLIVDPLSAYMGSGVDGHRDTDVRQALAGLAALAERTGLSVLCVRHLNKGGGEKALYRGGGSIAIIAAARSGLLLATDPDDDKRLVLAVTKGNLAPPQDSLSLRLVPNGTGVRVDWLGQSSQRAGDLLSADATRTTRDDASDFLRAELRNGPQPVKDLQSAARAAGLSWRTVRRAQNALGVVISREGFGPGGRYEWRLPTMGGQRRWPPMNSGTAATYEEPLLPVCFAAPAPPIDGQGSGLATYAEREAKITEPAHDHPALSLPVTP